MIGQQKYYYNTTIINTGYKPGQNVTEAQRSMAIQLALDNETVKQYLDGHDYTIYDVGLRVYDSGPTGQYIVTHPNVQILLNDTGTESYLYVGVDTNSKEVLYVNPVGYYHH